MKKIIAIAALVAAPILFGQNKLTTAKDAQVAPAKKVEVQKTDAVSIEAKNVEAAKANKVQKVEAKSADAQSQKAQKAKSDAVRKTESAKAVNAKESLTK